MILKISKFQVDFLIFFLENILRLWKLANRFHVRMKLGNLGNRFTGGRYESCFVAYFMLGVLQFPTFPKIVENA